MNLLILFWFVFGTVIGSFLNAVIYRLPKGETLLGRSKCPCCRKVLTFFELIPLISYVFLRGKCSNCESKISVQYPLVEVASGLVWLFAYTLGDTLTHLILLGVIFSLLIAIFTYDVLHMLIPDVFSMPLIVLSFILLFVENESVSFELLAVGPILALFFFILWLISKGRWMGFGDVKLAIPLGWLAGVQGAFFVFLLSFWIGAIVSIFLILVLSVIRKEKIFSMKSQVPFAPFLIIAYFIVEYWNISFEKVLSVVSVL
ncbi:MAG: prepilin peptidase [Candidatus Campbellbacteria bacterium]|nr:prepilin peptidase [Candidatus Campbellbacteria bacterium]